MNKFAYFASGCFWGTQYYLDKQDGVIDTTVGYIGGRVANPTYEQVSSGLSGHVEAVRVEYDPAETDFETLAKVFFETHDPSQADGQGPDIGSQYRSKIFYNDEAEHEIAMKLIALLENKGMKVATKVEPASEFYVAEKYHQQYYDKNGKRPYCHSYHRYF
jgi:peptide methionine sulfoxide reductase msrA/msrB